MASIELSPAPDKREQVLAEIEAGLLVDPAAVARARLVATRTRQPIEQVLNQLGALSDEALAMLYARVAQCEVWDAGGAADRLGSCGARRLDPVSPQGETGPSL